MPRQRKPQNGGQRLGTGRVANTTTSSNLQTVYRVPVRGAYGECEKLAYEVIGTSPIEVHIEGENIYRVSLDTAALEAAIENMNLDLSNVTLGTINGNINFTGNVTTEGSLTSNTITTNSVDAGTGDIDTLTSINITSTGVSTGTLETSGNTSVGGNLEVTGTSVLNGTVTTSGDLSVTGDLSTSGFNATTGTITTLSSEDASITNLSSTTGNITTLTSSTAELGQLEVTGSSSFTGAVSAGDITSTGNVVLNNASVSGNTTLANVTVNGASTLTGNTSVGGNLSVTGNETVTGNMSVTGDGIFSNDVSVSRNLNVTGDATIADDLTVNGSSHLHGVETDGSVDIDGTLRVTGGIDAGNGVSVTGQVESDSLVTTNAVVGTLHVGTGLYLDPGSTAGDFILQSEKNQPNGVAALDSNGKVSNSVLPPLAIGQTFVTDSEANMLALTSQTGDICVRTDISETFIKLNDNNPSTLADWQQLQMSGGVTSVNGQTGVVVLDADDIDDTSTTHKFVTTAQVTSWNAKEDTSNKDTATLVDSTTHYPSSHVLVDQLATKQATLVNQQNIKSINNQSLLGSGNLTITADVDFYYEQTTQGATTYTLQHTPISDSSIMIFSDSGTALFPMIDYTLNGNIITFVSLGTTESAIIWVAAQVANP